jgi:DNA-binding winged helix-turn-helix (wHTH) protein/TolB-like protein/Tfp pilus assembly protein PilF
MEGVAAEQFRFGEFELDAGRRRLTRDGVDVLLNPKAFDLLVELIRRSGTVVSKDELLEHVWPDQIVEENNLSVHVSALRKLLGDGKGSSRLIATIPGKGYSFVAPILQDEEIVIEQRTFERVIFERDSDTARHHLLTDHKSNRLPKYVFASLLLVTLTAAGLWWWKHQASASAQIDSIAIMPFVDETGSAENDLLADGMTESLINSLSRLPKLAVKARYSVFSYKGKRIDPAQIAGDLSVQAVLLGRIATRGDAVALSLELIDARTGDHIWGENYQRTSGDLFSLQTDISRDVADKLRRRLAGGESLVKGQTNDAEAFRLYTQGRFFWNKRTQKDHEKAIELFNAALSRDPNYALAWAGLGDVYSVDSYRPEGQDKTLKAREFAMKALEIEPELAEAYTILAKVAWDSANPVEANKNFLKAIDINPNYASAHHWYGEFLSQFDRQEHARSEINRAMELDPLSLVMMSDSAFIYYQNREYDAAIAQANKALELDPNWLFAKGAMSAAHEVKGEFGKALDIWWIENETSQTRSEKEKQEIREALATIRKRLETDGSRGYWLGAYEYARRDPREGDDFYIAICLTQLGRLSEALDELEKTVSQRQSFSGSIKVEPLFEPLKDEPRFKALLDKTGLNTEF